MRACAFALKYSPDLLQVTTTNYQLVAADITIIVAAFAFYYWQNVKQKTKQKLKQNNKIQQTASKNNNM